MCNSRYIDIIYKMSHIRAGINEVKLPGGQQVFYYILHLWKVIKIKKAELLRKEIENDKGIINGAWLLEKIEDLKTKRR